MVNPRRFAWRVFAQTLWILPLCGVLVWVGVNWSDADRQAVPEALVLAPDRIDAQANVYWDLAGLLAPAGADPHQVGFARWQAETAARKAAVAKGQLPRPSGLTFVPLRVPDGPPLVCRNEAICDELWFQNPDALQAQLRGHELLVQRCERIARRNGNFEEPLATVDASGQFAPHLPGLSLCARLLDAKGVMSAGQNDASASIQWFSLSNSLLMRAAVANRLAVTQFSTGHALVRHWRSVAAAGRRDSKLAQALLPLAGPLPAGAFDLYRSAAGSAAFARSAVANEAALCEGGGPCGRWPHLPLQTQADINGAWVAHVAQSRANPVDELDAVRLSPLERPSALEKFHVRNSWVRPSLAQIRLDLLSGAAELADVELVRATVQLSLSARAIGLPADERSAWLARQPMRASFRSRIELDVDAQSLVVRPWSREFNPKIPKDFLQFPFGAANP